MIGQPLSPHLGQARQSQHWERQCMFIDTYTYTLAFHTRIKLGFRHGERLFAIFVFFTYILSPRMTYSPNTSCSTPLSGEKMRSWHSSRTRFVTWSKPRRFPIMLRPSFVITVIISTEAGKRQHSHYRWRQQQQEKEAKWRNRMNQDEKTAIAKKMSKRLFVRGDPVHGTHCWSTFRDLLTYSSADFTLVTRLP